MAESGPLTGVRRLAARTPLRVRLVVALMALVAIGLTLTGVAAVTALRGYLVTQVDQDLSRRSGPMPRLGDPGTPGGDDSPFERSRAEWFQYTDKTGRPLAQAQLSSADEVNPPAVTRTEIRGAGSKPFTVHSDGAGADWRVSVREATLSAVVDGQRVQVDGYVVRAISLDGVGDTTQRLVLIELLVGVVVLGLLGAAGYVVVRRSLRPLVEVEGTAAAIAGGDLSRRVPESDPNTEVGRLSQALNAMLGQIETAFHAREASEVAARTSEDRMRRFVADASHELRTPLTSIRGFAELYRQGAASSPEAVARVMRRVEDSAAQMGLLVEDLLLLARLDQQRPLERRPVDLVALAADAVHDAEVVAPDRAVTLSVRQVGAAPASAPGIVIGDEARLRQVVANLVSNALNHTPASTAVHVEVETAPQAGQVRLAVRDEGPGLSEQDAARIFERFYRADTSRSRGQVPEGAQTGGSGLGLSIVSALVAAHGGRVGVDTAPGEGCTFWVILPLESRRAPVTPAPSLSASPLISPEPQKSQGAPRPGTGS